MKVRVPFPPTCGKMLAEAGFPTVLVDVDLRKSVMKTRFQMDYDDDTTMGLNHYLSGMAEYEDVCI